MPRCSACLLVALVFLAGCGKPGEKSGWLTTAETVALIKPLEEKASSVGGEGRKWVSAIESKWDGGQARHRVTTTPAPGGAYAWFWCINLPKDRLATRLEELDAKGFRLIGSLSSVVWPDGSERFSGVWHKQAATVSDSDGSGQN